MKKLTAKEKADPVTLNDYDRKSPSCSSPIVQVIDGKLYRVHDGHYLYGQRVVDPSKTLIEEVLK